MNKGVIALVGFLVIAVLGTFTVVSMYSSTHDTAVDYEGNIKKYYDASESQLSTFTLTIQEKVQVADKYKDGLKEVIGEYFRGRDGIDQKYVMSYVQQHAPAFDSKMYQDLMITIDSGRQAFNNIQKMKIEQCTEYEKFRKGFWTKKIIDTDVFPGENIAKMCVVVSDTRTKKAMDTGVQEVIKL